MPLSTASMGFHLNITCSATQHPISRVEISATQTKTSMGANNRRAGKLADSCTTALALSLSLALILACLSERKAGQLTSAISRYQIVPTYLRTPSYFGLMISLIAMRIVDISFLHFRFSERLPYEATLRDRVKVDLLYRRDSTPVHRSGYLEM